MISFAASGFLCRKVCAWSGFSEKKMGTRPCANVPSNMSALRENAPSRTETELSLLKNFFWTLAAPVGNPWISNLGSLVSEMPTAQRRQAPMADCAGELDVEGGFKVLMKNSAGTSWPSPSVMGTIPCLFLIYVNHGYV